MTQRTTKVESGKSIATKSTVATRTPRSISLISSFESSRNKSQAAGSVSPCNDVRSMLFRRWMGSGNAAPAQSQSGIAGDRQKKHGMAPLSSPFRYGALA